jgi:hypothetical protein
MSEHHHATRNSISDWDIDVGEISKDESIDMLEKLKLPTYKSVKMSSQEFLANPSKYLAEIGNPRMCWVDLMGPTGRNTVWHHVRKFDLLAEQAANFITTNIGEFSSNPILLLKQFFPNVFGGTLLITDDKIYSEIVRGSIDDLTHLQKTPELTMSRNNLTGLFEFAGDEMSDTEQTRGFLLRTLQKIPHDDARLRDRRYFPGYYEFILTYREDTEKPSEDWAGEPLKPLFVDYQKSPYFTLV